jgi:hypothetical protein
MLTRLSLISILSLIGTIGSSLSQSNILYPSLSPTDMNVHGAALPFYSDSVAGSWTYIAPLTRPLSGVASIYWQDSDKVFLCGGLDSNGSLQTTCYFYDPIGNSYIEKAPLPSGRAFGKLVRVANAIYLVGAVGPLWNAPDGRIFRYDPNLNSWTARDTMPPPFVHEMAVCVWKDSLIITIGGAANGYQQASNIVRVYNPRTDSWTVLSSSPFPVPATTSSAEILKDTAIITVGGYGSDYINNVYAGNITGRNGDTLSIIWRATGMFSPFGFPVYRAAGAKWETMLLFGPAMRYQLGINQIYGCYYEQLDSVNFFLTFLKFYPNSLDSAGNRPTLAVRPMTDSVQFFLFGGYKYPNIIANSERYSFPWFPIGISSNGNHTPRDFALFQNYPNPFNQSSIINYSIGSSGQLTVPSRVSLTIYDILGRSLAVLVDERQNAGNYSVRFDAAGLSSGIYFYRLTAGNLSLTKKLILLK